MAGSYLPSRRRSSDEWKCGRVREGLSLEIAGCDPSADLRSDALEFGSGLSFDGQRRRGSTVGLLVAVPDQHLNGDESLIVWSFADVFLLRNYELHSIYGRLS